MSTIFSLEVLLNEIYSHLRLSCDIVESELYGSVVVSAWKKRLEERD